MQRAALSSGGISRRVLVVDDDPFYQEMATSALRGAGYTVIAAENGEQALQLLSEIPFDVVTVDVAMPVVDGFEVTRRARAAGVTAPIIMVTGHEDTASVERAFAVGATSFVAKPINWPLFAQHVHFVHRAAETEIDLAEARRTAEFLSDLKSRVIKVLVSEFECSLRTASSLLELIRKEPFGPLGNRVYVDYANEAAKVLGELKTLQLKMLNAGRVLSEGLTLHEQSLPLKELVCDVIEALRPKADRRRLEFDLRIAIPDDAVIRCDSALVSQALKALIEGAIALSPRLSTITIDARLDFSQGFVFSVADDGPVLPDDILKEILSLPKPVRADEASYTIARNTGLTISRVLAEAHEGKLAIRSTQDDGTVARIVIPKSRVGTAEVAVRQPAEAIAGGAPLAPPFVRRIGCSQQG